MLLPHCKRQARLCCPSRLSVPLSLPRVDSRPPLHRSVGILGITKIPLGHFLTALKFVGQHSIDADEVECILANLIHQRYIKGYIAHQQRMLVVSAKEAFPALQKD